MTLIKIVDCDARLIHHALRTDEGKQREWYVDLSSVGRPLKIGTFAEGSAPVAPPKQGEGFVRAYRNEQTGEILGCEYFRKDEPKSYATVGTIPR